MSKNDASTTDAAAEAVPTPTPEASRRREKVIAGSTLSAGVIMALVLYGMVNYLSSRHYARFDWTSGSLYTLSEKSRAVVEGLDRDVEIVIALHPGSELYTAVDELAARYAAANPDHLKKRVLDPARDYLEFQRLVEQHGIERENVVIVASGNDRRVIDERELADYDYSGMQYGEGPKLEAFKGEQEITSAILELTEAQKPRIVFVTGHGEIGLSGGGQRSLSKAQTYLGRDNFEIDEWSAPGQASIPPETDLVVLAGPQTAVPEAELAMYSDYLDHGGRMLVLLDPVVAGSGEDDTRFADLGLGDWLSRYGVEVSQDLVVDPESQLLMLGPEVILTDRFGYHPVVETLQQVGARVHLPLARSVRRLDPPPAGMEVTELVKTSDAGWGETRLDADLTYDEGTDIEGPVSLGVAVSFPAAAAEPGKTAADEGLADGSLVEPAEDVADGALADEGLSGEDGGDEVVPLFEPDEPDETEEPDGDADADGTREARLVVVGDADFASGDIIDSAANRLLLLNAFNWLVQREQLITIEGRKPTETRLLMSGTEQLTVILLVTVVLPGLALAAGVSVFLRRRR